MKKSWDGLLSASSPPSGTVPRLLALLLNDPSAELRFPQHGIVALRTDDEGETWAEEWRVEAC